MPWLNHHMTDCYQACVYKIDVNPGKNKDICFRSNTGITDYIFDGNEWWSGLQRYDIKSMLKYVFLTIHLLCKTKQELEILFLISTQYHSWILGLKEWL